MDYHARNKSQEDVIRMPAYGSAFRDMEEKWHDFKEEPHNLRISLAAYGVNPFTWCGLFFFINNNIPPSLSIKREHIMLSMIIPSFLSTTILFIM